MKETNGNIKHVNNQGHEVEESLFTYSEEEKQENEINKENAKLVFSPKFIPFYPCLAKKGFTTTECLIYGFIDFYCSNGNAEGRFYFTNKQISEIICCSIDTVSRSISKLEKGNLIKTNRKIKAGGGQIRFVGLRNTYKYDYGFSTSHTTDFLQTNKNKINNNKININMQTNVCDMTNKILDIFYKINPSLNYGNKTQRDAVKWFVQRYGEEATIAMASKVLLVQGEKYAPVVTTPLQMKNKLAELKIYMNKEKTNNITFVG